MMNWARSLIFCSEGMSMDSNRAMTDITTRSSIKVKAFFVRMFRPLPSIVKTELTFNNLAHYRLNGVEKQEKKSVQSMQVVFLGSSGAKCAVSKALQMYRQHLR